MLSLSPEPAQTLAGRTYYSDSTLGAWPKPTGVYLPPGTDTDTGFVDMLIYLHGHLVPSIDQLFNRDGVAVRQQVLASGKKVVLAAPWLGLGGSGIFGAFLHMLNNGIIKGVMFLSAGNIHRAYDSKYVEDVSGALRRVPWSGALFLAGFFAVTGSPPFGPFVSELSILR